MPKPIIIRSGEMPRALDIRDEKITVLASAEQTASYEGFHQTGTQGSGPPAHSHDWDEAWYVIKGEIELGVGDEELIGGPGTFIHIPGGTVHWFHFLQDDGELISWTSGPGSAAIFTEVDRMFAAGEATSEKMTEYSERFHLTVVLPRS